METTRIKSIILTSLLIFGISASAENIITNGSFEEHGAFDHNNWGTFTEIPGWKAESEPFEIQRGKTSGINAVEGNNKLELDANNNSVIHAMLPTQANNDYILQFSYSPRVQKKRTNTNNISVWWDDKKIKKLSGHKRGWKNYSYLVNAPTDGTKLTLKAEGKSDSLGGLIDNVQVFSTSCFTDNKIKNGSFEQHGQLDHGRWGAFKSIPNWDVTSG